MSYEVRQRARFVHEYPRVSLPDYTFDAKRLAALTAYRILDTAPEEGFDDVVQLASAICEAPVALVSFVGSDRQWFKARTGFASPETDLDRSVCAHALVEPDLLVIEDLEQDHRTRANPLVADGPRIRFYAGAPLRTREGDVLGSLCVIDDRPRAGGLTEAQAKSLRALARQVISLLELRRSLALQQAEERRYHALFDAVSAGFCIIQMRFRNGEAVDYRFLEVNKAFEQQTGLVGAQGRWMRDIAPAHEQRWFDMYGRVALTGEPATFEDHSAVLGRYFSVHAFRTGEPEDHQVAVLFQDITERRRAEAGARQNEEQLRLALAAGGGIGVWDWDVKANCVSADARFAELYGVDPLLAASGAPIESFFRNVHPDDLQDLRRELDAAVQTGNDFHAEYRLVEPDGSTTWVAASGQPLMASDGTPIRFPGVSYDITERKQAEERQTALLRLGDALRDATDRQSVLGLAARTLGQTLQASRAGYELIDNQANTLTTEQDWTVGVASLKGTHSLTELRATIARLRNGETLVVSNVPATSWLAPDYARYSALSVRSMIKIPLIAAGELTGILFVHNVKGRTWTPEEVAFAHAVADRTYAVVAKLDAEQHQKVLNQELSHRLKNTMAMVQAIARSTLRSIPDRAPVEAFEKRLLALSSAHNVLLQENWAEASILEVVQNVLAAFDGLARFDISGPDIRIGPRATLSLSLLLHELTTNALKYGALSNADGRVAVAWRIDDADLVFEWKESGGPPAKTPVRQGFGSRLIAMGLVGTGGAERRYAETGLEATFRAPFAQVQKS